MPANKNQHYVPKFYLKLFSNNLDRKSIGIWSIKNDTFVRTGGIKDQASLDYFYGKDLELEKAFGQQETLMSQIYAYIIETNHLFKPMSQQHIDFLSFVLLMTGRTKFAADRINEITDNLAKIILKHNPEIKDHLDKFEVKSSNAVIEAIDNAINGLPLAVDLQFKMVINESITPFILSDNPVALHNQFLRDRKWPGGHTGIAQPGLQIFVPLSPRCTMIFYDSKVYKLGNRKGNIVKISKTKDIDQLNQMQFLNAGQTLYFNEGIDETYCRKLSDRAKKLRNTKKINLSEFKNLDDPRGLNTIVAINDPGRNMDLRLNCLKILKKSQKIQIGPSMYNVRDHRAVEEHKKWMEEMEKEKKEFLEKEKSAKI